jgi:integrase
MARVPRGTTVRVKYYDDPWRKEPWAVHWNEYKPEFFGRPKQRSKWLPTAAKAEEWAAELRAQLLGTVPPPRQAHLPAWTPRADSFAALTGFDYSDLRPLRYTGWLRRVQQQREANTLRNYSDCVKNYLAPAPGHKRYPGLGTLIVSDATCTSKVFADYMEELYAAGVSLVMRKRLKSALSAFCSWAKFAGKLTGDNPCYGLGRILRHKGEENQKAEPNPFTGDEVTRFFDQLEAAEDACWVVYFQFLLDVGVRPGEAAALKWTALKLDQRKAEIELAYSTAGKEDKLPKTHERRTVQLTRRLVDLLLQWKVTQAEEAFRRFGQKAPVYVFTTRRGTRCLQDGTMPNVFARVTAACEITGHTPYNFRDTFATSHLLGSWDRKLAWVSKQLGHATPRTTEQFYYKYRDTSASDSFADEITTWGK